MPTHMQSIYTHVLMAHMQISKKKRFVLFTEVFGHLSVSRHLNPQSQNWRAKLPIPQSLAFHHEASGAGVYTGTCVYAP